MNPQDDDLVERFNELQDDLIEWAESRGLQAPDVAALCEYTLIQIIASLCKGDTDAAEKLVAGRLTHMREAVLHIVRKGQQ